MELRPVEVGDRTALDALFSLADECDGHFPIGEHKYLDLMARAGPCTGLVAVEHDTVVAYVALTPPRHDSIAALELAIHPLHRSNAVIDELIREGVAAVSEMYAAAVRVWAFQPNMVDRLRAAGFRTERELRQLRIDLPTTESAPPPAGMEERRFRPGADEEAWLAVNNAAFREHPENGSWTRAILADRLDQPWFDQAMLYMDSDNARAAALYDSLGFRLHHVDRSMMLELVE